MISNIDGDFNRDGRVDAADYVVWRDNRDNNFTPADFVVWKSNFGAVAPKPDAAAVSFATVPEPSSMLLVVLGLILQFGGVFRPLRTRPGSLACAARAS